MARKERTSKGRTMIPNYFVFCEGDTEVVYVEMLRQHYRLPIHIIPRKTLLNITPALVERCEAAYIQTKNDQTFIKQYKKGVVDVSIKQYLMTHLTTATERAKEMQPHNNPSTTVYLLTDKLEELKSMK